MGLHSDQLMSIHVRSHEHSQGLAIEVLESPDHGWGTVCPVNCDSKTFASPSLGGYLRHFCSLRLGALCLLCFDGARYKHSYVFTYLLSRKCSVDEQNLPTQPAISYYCCLLTCWMQVKWRSARNDITNGGYSTEGLQCIFAKVRK